MSVVELRRKYRAIHSRARVQRAEDAACLMMARKVYELAGARREAAEDAVTAALGALERARATEDEWRCTVHGLALRYAAAVDAGERNGSA